MKGTWGANVTNENVLISEENAITFYTVSTGVRLHFIYLTLIFSIKDVFV